MPTFRNVGELAHVRVADDHVQPAEALGVGVRLVPRVDDGPRPRGGRGDALPDVLGALGDAVLRASRARAAPSRRRSRSVGSRRTGSARRPSGRTRPGGPPGSSRGSRRSSRRVRVVLEQVDVAGDALLVQAHLGRGQQRLEDPLARLVVRDQVHDACRTRASRTRGASRRRGTGGRRSPGRRWTTGPSGRPAGTGTGRPRRARAGAAPGTCTSPRTRSRGRRSGGPSRQPTPAAAEGGSSRRGSPTTSASARRRNLRRCSRVRSSTPASIVSGRSCGCPATAMTSTAFFTAVPRSQPSRSASFSVSVSSSAWPPMATNPCSSVTLPSNRMWYSSPCRWRPRPPRPPGSPPRRASSAG